MTAALLFVLLAFQLPTAESIALGDLLLRGGDAAAAAAAYEDAARAAQADGLASPALDYRLGRAHLASGALGPARLHLERAARRLPADSAVQAALDEARVAVGADAALPPPPLTQTALWLTGPLGATAAFGFGWALLVLAAAFAGWWVRKRENLGGVLGRRVAFAAGALGAVLVASALLAAAEVDAERGVVQRPVLLGRLPGDASGASVAAGRLVRLQSEEGSWREVRLPSGGSGWLPADAVAELWPDAPGSRRAPALAKP